MTYRRSRKPNWCFSDLTRSFPALASDPAKGERERHLPSRRYSAIQRTGAIGRRASFVRGYGTGARVSHSELVSVAAKWLKRQGCNVVLTERFAGNDHRGECPDAIGWWCGDFSSAVIECKTSMSDFIADGKKPWRKGPAMGAQRWFLTPAGLLNPMIVPERWGVLEWTGRIVRKLEKAQAFPPYMRDVEAEAKLLLAELRIFHAQGITYQKFKIGSGSVVVGDSEPSNGARAQRQDPSSQTLTTRTFARLPHEKAENGEGE